MNQFPASFFDGQTARAHPVLVTVEQGSIQVVDVKSNTTLWKLPFSKVRISEPLGAAATRIETGEMDDSAVVEVPDAVRFWQSLEANGFKQSFVQKRQNSWQWAGICAVLALAFLGLMYWVIIPKSSELVATRISAEAEAWIGDQAWPDLEKQLFPPSNLTQERQNALREEFAKRVAMLPNAPKYELHFRSSKIGPNAVAIPGGRIVMTDELVKMAKGDDAIYGVLFHELGHVKHRHSLRNILQTAAVSAILSAWLGDVSAIATLIPATIANSGYSRDLEREADQFAVEAMIATNTPPAAMIDLFTRIAGGRESALEKALSSHPVTSERIEVFKKAQTAPAK